MNDLVQTFIPLFKNFGTKLNSYIVRKYRKLKDNNGNLLNYFESDLSVTKYFQDRVWNVLLSKENISDDIDNLMKLFWIYIQKIDLLDDNNQRLVFEELKKFLNYFWFILRKNSRYLENTLSSNKIEYFNKKTLWEKINDITPKNNYLQDWNYWASCRHYTLLFKDFFDQLENMWLKIENYLFVEDTDWSDHLWLIITFEWENFLVDAFSDLRKRFVVQSIKKLPEDLFERMKSLENFSKNDINDDNLAAEIEKYKNGDENYRKICFKNADDLFQLLSCIIKNKWAISLGRFEKKNILDLFMWTHFNFFRDWILFSRTFFYHFDKIFDEESLRNISDEDLLEEVINHISYKTEKGKNIKIKVFDFEKKHLLSRLSYFADRIDYSHLRKILVGSWSELS